MCVCVCAFARACMSTCKLLVAGPRSFPFSIFLTNWNMVNAKETSCDFVFRAPGYLSMHKNGSILFFNNKY